MDQTFPMNGRIDITVAGVSDAEECFGGVGTRPRSPSNPSNLRIQTSRRTFSRARTKQRKSLGS